MTQTPKIKGPLQQVGNAWAEGFMRASRAYMSRHMEPEHVEAMLAEMRPWLEREAKAAAIEIQAEYLQARRGESAR